MQECLRATWGFEVLLILQRDGTIQTLSFGNYGKPTVKKLIVIKHLIMIEAYEA